MPEQLRGIALLHERSGQPRLEILDRSPDSDVHVAVDQPQPMPRQIRRPQVHRTRALTLHVRFLVLALELERLDVGLDPTIRVGSIGLGQLRQQAIVVRSHSEDAFELYDRRGYRFAGKLVVPVRFKRRGRPLEESCRRLGGELRDVAAAERHNAQCSDRRSKVAWPQILVHGVRCTKIRGKLSIEIVWGGSLDGWGRGLQI